MAKLSHIEDFEPGASEEIGQVPSETLGAQDAQQLVSPVQSAQPSQPTPTAEAEQPAETVPESQSAQPAQPAQAAAGKADAAPKPKSLAAQDAEFHGISTSESLGIGHTVLAVAAAVVFLGAIAYIANYWFHFI